MNARDFLRCWLLAAALTPLAVLAARADTACGPHSDMLVRSDTTLAPVRPAECASVGQTPPEFTWPPQDGDNTYTLTLTRPDGKTESRTTKANWLLWDHALAPGRYSWRIKSSGASTQTSDPRSFTIARDAVPFVVPPPEALLQRAKQTPRPRTWRAGDDALKHLKSSRDAAFRSMLEEVQNKFPAEVQPEPSSGSIESNYEDTVAEQKRTLSAALAWAVTHERRYGDDAFRRVMAQARWNTQGTLAYKTNDMASRTVAWTLALAYDWLHDYLHPSQKAVVAAAIRERVQPMYEEVLKLAAYPYDSHGNISLTIVGAIGALMAGDIPEADAWVTQALPLAVAWTSPWGWEDGGFGNGTAQAFWDTGSNLPAWQVIRSATGLDLSKKDWVRNHGRFLAYFVPPGSPSGVFGDGLELDLHEVWARVGKAYARFAPSPLARWYAHSQRGEDEARFELLMSAQRDGGAAPFPAGSPGAAVFPSIGWAAMHSDLQDPKRVSVYFKSSPYGSYNHSHADQNSFVIHDKGRRLAFASGYYDGYKTAHWNEWYHQTRAANAITFDGGRGQGLNDRRFAGEITRFESTRRYDYAIGHAEKAYDGALTKAQRTIVYLRPDVVLVHDIVAAPEPHAWEWNIHAAERMERVGERTVELRNGPARLCLEMLAAPEVAFEQSNRFTAPPQGNPPPRDQWHGVFQAASPAKDAEFVALMRVGASCAHDGKPSAAASRVPGGWRVDLGQARVTLSGDAVKVE
ncbi:MAG TPA: DUF4962 domain-containing protein [Usitatibacter sp.]|nr:DUF4962 domain-containing protein [Usitatibacter sp.]